VIAASTASSTHPILAYHPGAFPSQAYPGEAAATATIVAAIANSISGLPLGEVHLPSALVLGPAPVCFLPWSFKGKWAYEKHALLVIAVLALLATAASGALKSIGLLPISPLLAILTVYGIHNLYMNVRRPALLIASAIALFLWNGPIFWKAIA